MSELGNNGRGNAECRQGLWEMLVIYANGPADENRVHTFTSLINAGMGWVGAEGIGKDGSLNAIARCFDIEEDEGVAQLAVLANNYHAPVVGVMTWLSNPFKYRELAKESAYFLMIFGADIQEEWEPSDSYKPGRPLLKTSIEACHSVLSPVARFLKDQVDRHDISGEPLRSVIPIALCDRQGCGRFRIVKVNRDAAHVFCSNLCKASFHQSAKTKGAKAEYMRDYRGMIDRNKPKAARSSAKERRK